MKKIGIVLLILISLIGTLLGCGKQDVNKDLESIDAVSYTHLESKAEVDLRLQLALEQRCP